MPVQRRWTNLWKLGVGAALLLGGGIPAPAQATGLEQQIAAELQVLAAHASTAFVGQITSIERKGSFVEVTFRVEEHVVGSTGTTYKVREWAGLWPPGQSRYIVGQRALAFLHAASGAGLSGPVHGAEGLIPVVVQGISAARLLDVRRVAAAVVRSPGTPLPAVAESGMSLSDVLRVISPRNSDPGPVPTLVPLPMRGDKPVNLPKKGSPRYPVALPVQPHPWSPGKLVRPSEVLRELR